jgi:hypothetical protein
VDLDSGGVLAVTVQDMSLALLTTTCSTGC